MSTKFVECTLGVKYRDVDEDGTVYGGPMYYLSKGFTKKGLSGFGKVLAIIFAVLCVGQVGSSAVGEKMVVERRKKYLLFKKTRHTYRCPK